MRLERVALPTGRTVWFPVYAEHESFLYGRGFQKTPVFHEKYGVVQGSLVFNDGLTDERFSIKWKGQPTRKSALDKAARDFASTPKVVTPHERTDPVGVQEYQNEKLAEANRQAAQLDASPPARRGWDWTLLTQSAMLLVGAGTLVMLYVARRRFS